MGIVVGLTDGLMERVVLGEADGMKAIGGLRLGGVGVKLLVGISEGLFVGLKMGFLVGLIVGPFVGFVEGFLVGRRRWTFPCPIPK